VTSLQFGFGACAPEAIKAARPPGLSTAKDFCATSPPTVSKTASQPVTTWVKSRVGEDGVGFGSDFDGAKIPAGIGNAAGLQNLVEFMRSVVTASR
jgi:hypothetical protein